MTMLVDAFGARINQKSYQLPQSKYIMQFNRKRLKTQKAKHRKNAKHAKHHCWSPRPFPTHLWQASLAMVADQRHHTGSSHWIWDFLWPRIRCLEVMLLCKQSARWTPRTCGQQWVACILPPHLWHSLHELFEHELFELRINHHSNIHSNKFPKGRSMMVRSHRWADVSLNNIKKRPDVFLNNIKKRPAHITLNECISAIVSTACRKYCKPMASQCPFWAENHFI